MRSKWLALSLTMVMVIATGGLAAAQGPDDAQYRDIWFQTQAFHVNIHIPDGHQDRNMPAGETEFAPACVEIGIYDGVASQVLLGIAGDEHGWNLVAGAPSPVVGEHEPPEMGVKYQILDRTSLTWVVEQEWGMWESSDPGAWNTVINWLPIVDPDTFNFTAGVDITNSFFWDEGENVIHLWVQGIIDATAGRYGGQVQFWVVAWETIT